MPGYWRRPLSLMYDHNYRYGTGLYSSALDDAERKYRHALFRSHLSSDRPYYGSYLSYLTPSRTYWPSTTKTGPYKKTYFYYDIPYYSYTSPYSSSYISPYSYYTRLHYPSTYYYYRPYYSTYRPYYSTYSYYYPYTSYYYSPYIYDSDLYDLKRSRSEPSLLRRSYSMDDLSYKGYDDYWVPLSSYLYRSPSAADLTDYDIKSKKRWRELDELEWQLKSGKTADMYESSLWADKCQDFQSKLDSVRSRMAEAESAIKEEMLGSQGRFHSDLTDMARQLQETHRQNEELLRVIKRQAKELTNMQSNYEETCRQVDAAADYLYKSRKQCEDLQVELEELKKKASERIIRTTTICY